MEKKSRSFNFLIELLIVIVFFTISVIVCVNVFYQAKGKSALATNISEASLGVLNVVEGLKVDDSILDSARYENGLYVLECDDYNVYIELISSIDTGDERYVTYEIWASDDNHELIRLETTCISGR